MKVKQGPARAQRTTKSAQPPSQAAAAAPRPAGWGAYALGIAAALVVAYIVYFPALDGEFVFDDLHLPMFQQAALLAPLRTWWAVRPLLMTTYYVNFHVSGLQPFPFHFVNLLFHVAASSFLFFILRKILELTGTDEPKRPILATFGAALFLLHPIQTESVSYVAQRAECMAGMFFMAAWCLFLYRKREEISWLEAVGVLALFGAAITTKEDTVGLPAILILTDYYCGGFAWQSIRRNWRLYLPIVAGTLVGSVVILRYLKTQANTGAGFSLKDFTWYQYFFTEWRVFFLYLALFVYPVWQTIDYDFSVSHTISEHGALTALLGILVLAVAAFVWRKRFPLASFGYFAFILLLLPTSSIVPLKDVVADRRMYLALPGLILIVLEFARRVKADRRLLATASAVVCLVFAGLTFQRNKVWSSSMNLWTDAVRKAPEKARPHFGLGVVYSRLNHCKEAAEQYSKAATLEKPDFQLLLNWGEAYACSGQPDKALEVLQASIRDKPTAVAWTAIALVEAKEGKLAEPLAALDQAEAIDPIYPLTYIYRGGLHQAIGQFDLAKQDFERALKFDPVNQMAIDALEKLKSQTGGAAPR